jgi:hypothetical protein
LPLGGLLIPTPGTNLPATPGGSENKPGSIPPSTEGGLPGLGPEPEPGKPLSPTPPANALGTSTSPVKVPATNAPKSPEKPPKSSMWEGGPRLGNTSDVTATYPAQPSSVRSARQQAGQKNDQPPAITVGGTKTEGLVALAGSIEPERNCSLAAACRADAIGVAAEPAATVEPAAYALAESPPKPAAVTHATLPSVALGGYCPVELGGNGRWVLGDLRWTVVHQGWIYRLSGPEQRRQFLADPDRFAPANSGNDAVMSVAKNCGVPGKTAYCAIYNNRLYMFSSAVTQAEFNRNPERYAVRK